MPVGEDLVAIRLILHGDLARREHALEVVVLQQQLGLHVVEQRPVALEEAQELLVLPQKLLGVVLPVGAELGDLALHGLPRQQLHELNHRATLGRHHVRCEVPEWPLDRRRVEPLDEGGGDRARSRFRRGEHREVVLLVDEGHGAVLWGGGFEILDIGRHEVVQGQHRVVRHARHRHREAVAVVVEEVDVGGEAHGLVGDERHHHRQLVLGDPQEHPLGEVQLEGEALLVGGQAVLDLQVVVPVVDDHERGC
mmetsp:Transcript_4457/g.14452  ORF Transcript_4457/g.14452 Transcript_4457/m.14452 type:complete len:252 (-) Transcript_4457:2368-3123(-)